jgi:hypothetical protein
MECAHREPKSDAVNLRAVHPVGAAQPTNKEEHFALVERIVKSLRRPRTFVTPGPPPPVSRRDKWKYRIHTPAASDAPGNKFTKMLRPVVKGMLRPMVRPYNPGPTPDPYYVEDAVATFPPLHLILTIYALMRAHFRRAPHLRATAEDGVVADITEHGWKTRALLGALERLFLCWYGDLYGLPSATLISAGNLGQPIEYAYPQPHLANLCASTLRKPLLEGSPTDRSQASSCILCVEHR